MNKYCMATLYHIKRNVLGLIDLLFRKNLYCILISMFIAYILTLIIPIPKSPIKLPVEDYSFKSCLEEIDAGHKFITTGWDSQLIYDFDTVRQIGNIQINFDQPTEFPWKLQVYYAAENENFTEEKSVIYNVEKGSSKIVLGLGYDMISKLRIDLGDESGRMFSIRRLDLNSTAYVIKIALLFILFLSVYICLQLIKHIRNNTILEKKEQFCCLLFAFIIIVSGGAAWTVNMLQGKNLFDILFNNSGAINGVSMTFTTLNFLFLFLPITLVGYYLVKSSIQNIFLVIISIVFYAVGEPVMVWLLILSVILNYFVGLLLAKEWAYKCLKVALLILILFWNFGLLFYYKYYIFTLENINSITGMNLLIPKIIQPLGISFFTFRTISFCLDVYWGTVPVQYNFIDVALYICFFPQISMGPISKYNDFSIQIRKREFSSDVFLDGIRRFIIGMAKKLIIANNIGSIVDVLFNMHGFERSVLLSWLGILSYLVQLYYDFSGYSDMAIGIGQLFGFATPENFNYPYISKSIVEFWGRWHITLGTWLKNYLYTPIFRALQSRGRALGICNFWALLGVWLFAGIWHGAGWNFICYGLYNFLFIIIERVVEDYQKKKRKKLKLKKQPETLLHKVLGHVYFFVVFIFAQVLFRCPDLTNFWEYIKSMFGKCNNIFCDSTTYFYWKQISVLFIIGWIFAFPIVRFIKSKLVSYNIERVLTIITPLVYAILLVVSISFAVTDTYQSFIYFQF